jgi:hypothetical protein
MRLATGKVLSLLGTKQLTKFHVINSKNSYIWLCCFISCFMLRLYQSLRLYSTYVRMNSEWLTGKDEDGSDRGLISGSIWNLPRCAEGIHKKSQPSRFPAEIRKVYLKGTGQRCWSEESQNTPIKATYFIYPVIIQVFVFLPTNLVACTTYW